MVIPSLPFPVGKPIKSKSARYYELRDGDPPYAAKFYDCCGAEDPDAPGCTTDFHRSYDDDGGDD